MGIRRVAISDTLVSLGVHEDALAKARAVADKKEIPLRQAIVETRGVDTVARSKAMSKRSAPT